MSNWIYLTKQNIGTTDILEGEWEIEFQEWQAVGWVKSVEKDIMGALLMTKEGRCKYRIRRPQPKAICPVCRAENPVKSDQNDLSCKKCGASLRHPDEPTHPERMTLWWKDETEWMRVEKYDSQYLARYLIDGNWHTKDWFIGRESSDVPPEES